MMRQPFRLQTIMIKKKKDANIALAPSRIGFLSESGSASRCACVNAIGAPTIAARVKISDLSVNMSLIHTKKLHHSVYQRKESPRRESEHLVQNVAFEPGRFPSGKPSHGENRGTYGILRSTFDDSLGRHCASHPLHSIQRNREALGGLWVSWNCEVKQM